MKKGLLIADQLGMFRLYEADLGGCWHYDTDCDGTCATEGAEVAGFEPTNAFGPATVRADRLGYEDARGEW